MQCYSQCIRYDNRLTCEKGDQYEEKNSGNGTVIFLLGTAISTCSHRECH